MALKLKTISPESFTEARPPVHYSLAFSIREEDLIEMLKWMRRHDCAYMRGNQVKAILESYTNEEILKNGLMGMAFEQYGNDGSKPEADVSIILRPSVTGTKYRLRCRCGEEFEPAERIASGMPA